ncbi:MAG: Asp-tRNA(Asn)/Glu-tRNA(Gln) amidotransferase subunit GatA [Chlamydiae bacterium]|nr:Asp-tRNA(Asn)/Glu-tRNA(Gln) amidotransferase subunit GatA [Chlamydiota bacterium]
MYRKSAQELNDHFQRGEISAKQIVEETFARIEKNDPKIQSFLSLFKQRAEEKAEVLDKKRSQGKPLGKLAAIPIAVKDNIHVKGEITTCGSKFLSNYKAVFNASAIKFIEEEDGILIGKTNMDEFGMGSSTENSAYFPTRNPWDLSCTPGGSSGGSSACVAARLCPLALGTDTGGSIRQPAAFTNLVGFKPSYGRVSRYGLVAYGSSLDQIGPLSRTVADSALLMEVIGRHCEHDSTSINSPQEDYLKKIQTSIQGKTVGVPWSFLENLAPEAKANFLASMEVLKTLGVKIVEINLDILKYSIAVYYILATAEASTNLARFDGIRYGNRSKRAKTLDEIYAFSKQEGFGPEVKNRILLGTYVLSAGYNDQYYKKAQKVRSLIIEQYRKAFSTCDMIAMPVSPFPAFPIGSINDPLQMYLQDIYTISINLAGLPAISVPSGFNKEGKPFGLQFIGSQMQDAEVLRFADNFEKATLFTKMIPPLFEGKATS